MTPEEINDAVEEAITLLAANLWVVEHAQCGSSLVAPDPKDVDFVVLINSYTPNLRWPFPGFSECSQEDYGDDTWCALRRGNINLLVTQDRGFFDRTVLATKLVIRLNLTEKDDRVAVHQIVVDGK